MKNEGNKRVHTTSVNPYNLCEAISRSMLRDREGSMPELLVSLPHHELTAEVRSQGHPVQTFTIHTYLCT